MPRRCRSCLTVAEPRKRNCQACGKKLPKPGKRKQPHMAALDQPRDAFVAANQGYDGCWICRRLGIKFKGVMQRDHWHTGPNAGQPRGILCIYHNRKLGAVYTPELLQAALEYVRKAA